MWSVLSLVVSASNPTIRPTLAAPAQHQVLPKVWKFQEISVWSFPISGRSDHYSRRCLGKSLTFNSSGTAEWNFNDPSGPFQPKLFRDSMISHVKQLHLFQKHLKIKESVNSSKVSLYGDKCLKLIMNTFSTIAFSLHSAVTTAQKK